MTVRRTEPTPWLPWLAITLALGWVSVQGADGQLAPAPVSVVQVPLELDLTPLFEVAESALPVQAGQWPGWRRWHGIDARYRAWRGPLSLVMQGDVLHAQAHVRYQVQARKGLIAGIGLSAGCGVKEAPRQALVGLQARLDWTPDWALHPRFRVLPTRFLDRCELTVADIDVSPLVGRQFEDRIESAVSGALVGMMPRLRTLRGHAERAWQAIQAPRELIPGLWLRVQPLGIALAPPAGSGSKLHSTLWFAFRAMLSGDDPGAALTQTTLPPLMPYRPSHPGLRFALSLDLPYPALSAALGNELVGQTLALDGETATLDGLVLSGIGEDLVLSAELSGDLAGRLTIMARPGFDPEAQVLRLEQVEFLFDSEDLNQVVMTRLFYDQIRARIESEANALMAARTQGLSQSLSEALTRDLSTDIDATLSDFRISDLRIQVGDSGLRVTGAAQGALDLSKTR